MTRTGKWVERGWKREVARNWLLMLKVILPLIFPKARPSLIPRVSSLWHRVRAQNQVCDPYSSCLLTGLYVALHPASSPKACVAPSSTQNYEPSTVMISEA